MSIARPGARFAFSHPAHLVALGFGVGLAPFAPGTFGTLLALPIWWLMGGRVSPLEFFCALGFFFVAGVWACRVTGRHLGSSDHGAMVWDEVVAFLLILALIPDEPVWQAAGFLVFRAFDVAKPPPIRRFERRLAGGLGVMFDDLLAAGYTLIVLAVAKRLLA